MKTRDFALLLGNIARLRVGRSMLFDDILGEIFHSESSIELMDLLNNLPKDVYDQIAQEYATHCPFKKVANGQSLSTLPPHGSQKADKSVGVLRLLECLCIILIPRLIEEEYAG